VLGNRAATIGLLVLVVLMLSSCGDDGERTAGSVDRRHAWVRMDDQPVVVAPNPSLVTGFDAGVAVLNLEWALDPSAPDRTAVAVLAEDGSWFSLPTPAPVSGAQISRAGDTLVLIGASGVDLVVQTLAPGAEQWTHSVADVGRVSDDSDWSITGGSELAAVAATSFGVLIIGPDGAAVVVDEPSQLGSTTQCIVDDQLFRLGSAVTAPKTDGADIAAGLTATLPEELEVLSLADPSSGWRDLEPPPGPFDATGHLGCGPDGPLFITGDVEHYWSDGWMTAPITGGSFDQVGLLAPNPGVVADTTSYFVDNATADLLERTAPGQWVRLDQSATDVVRADASVYAVDANANGIAPIRTGS
jgi:hypothetical protein